MERRAGELVRALNLRAPALFVQYSRQIAACILASLPAALKLLLTDQRTNSLSLSLSHRREAGALRKVKGLFSGDGLAALGGGLCRCVLDRRGYCRGFPDYQRYDPIHVGLKVLRSTHRAQRAGDERLPDIARATTASRVLMREEERRACWRRRRRRSCSGGAR